MPHLLSTTTLILALTTAIISTTTAQLSAWTTCDANPALECATLSVPLEWASTSSSTARASIALTRYPATVAASQRLGSLLINPGGPGASGVLFVQNPGTAASLSLLSGGRYDIIGFDPRGVGASEPLLTCFGDVGTEWDFDSGFPAAPNLWAGTFANASFDAQIEEEVTVFDGRVKELADACAAQASEALYTSTTAYVARDMRAIVDALERSDGKLNYWAFSYGTIHLVEFIQLFPERVGRVIADGVFDAEDNVGRYEGQFVNDQVSVRGCMEDFVTMCGSAGEEKCAFATAPEGLGSQSGLMERLDSILEDLYLNPIALSPAFNITLDTLSPTLWSLLRLPPTWSYLARILAGLEHRNATVLTSFLTTIAATPEPANRSAPATGTLNAWPLQCVDNAPSADLTVAQIIDLTEAVSLEQDTPLLSADLTPLSFCRHFPTRRPLVQNLGISKIAQTDALLAACNTSVLILNPEHDPVTPLESARRLRSWLGKSSRLLVRGGGGHTSVSLVSLGTAKAILGFLVDGTLPVDGEVVESQQDVFPVGGGEGFVEGSATFVGREGAGNETVWSEEDKGLMDAVYGVFLGFLGV